MRCLAVDDEPLALEIIKTFCNKVPFIETLTVCSSGVEAISILQQDNIDLLFLDINMPHMSGLELASLLRNPPMLIFTTAYQDHALEGFDLSAIDYLVKPFSFERFVKAVSKAYELYSLRKKSENAILNGVSENEGNGESGNNVSKSSADDYFIIKVEYSNVKVRFDDILYIEGLKDYVKIYTTEKNLVTKSTMKNVEEHLPSSSFMRVHKSYIVGVSHIEAIENNHIVIGTHRIPLGGGYKDEFLAFIESKRL